MPEIRNLLEPLIPRLRRYARALTRDASRADDLVQSCLVRAIAKQHLWQEGTDLRAWLFTILHNLHVNEVRRLALNGAVVPIEEVASMLPVHENATDSVQLLDLHRAIGCLSEEQRQILLLVGLEELQYDDVAKVLQIPLGTVRSRLSRARNTLREVMGMHEKFATGPARNRARGSRRSHYGVNDNWLAGGQARY